MSSLWCLFRRSRWDACKLLPPWNKGPGYCFLLHAGGYHHARHHPGVRAGCKCDTRAQVAQRPQWQFWEIHGHWFLQKINKKKHFSKTKHSKFNESGQLSAFYLFSFGWGASILLSVRIVSNLGFLLILLVLRTKLKDLFFFVPSRKTSSQIQSTYGKVIPMHWCRKLQSADFMYRCSPRVSNKPESSKHLFIVSSTLLKIPDEILLHLSAGLLVARTPRTLFPKDKEGECVFWLVFRPWAYILFDFPWFFCIVVKNYILYD